MDAEDLFKSTCNAPFTESRTLSVYRSSDIVVACGANEGDGFGIASELVLDDIYRLRENVAPASLVLMKTATHYAISTRSGIGTSGHKIHLDCVVTLMDLHQAVIDTLVLAEVDPKGHLENTYLLPLAPLLANRDYSLLRVDQPEAAQKMAKLTCASFSRGTQITLASGRQTAVDNLTIGTLVLTRDNGAQPIRSISHYTERAIGAFAPIRIAAGALDNTDDLIVSPDHRLFFYQRKDHLGAGRPEVMVRARDLLDDRAVAVLAGGFVEYFQIQFDSHQIIYAGGIAAESMMVHGATTPMLESAPPLGMRSAGSGEAALHELEIQRTRRARSNALALLKRASWG